MSRFHYLTLSLVLCLLMFPAGCMMLYHGTAEQNATAFIEEVTESQPYYDNLVLSDPMNATAWTLRGNYFNDVNNQYEKALSDYDRALELDPANGYAWYSKGITLQNMHRVNESQYCFDNARRFGFFRAS